MKGMRVLRYSMLLLLLLGSSTRSAELSSSTPSACRELPVAWSNLIAAGVPLAQASAGYCEADCGSGTTVSCTASSCSAQDRNCSLGIRGSVTCGSQTTWCPYSCSQCTPGEVKQAQDGCCALDRPRFRWYVCNSNGSWQMTPDFTCYKGPCDPLPLD